MTLGLEKVKYLFGLTLLPQERLLFLEGHVKEGFLIDAEFGRSCRSVSWNAIFLEGSEDRPMAGEMDEKRSRST